MKMDDSKILKLREKVKAVREEFEMAIAMHEVWKPTEFDEDLHKRMGISFAGNSLKIIRVALRREMLLALMRLWDNSPRAVGMKRIAEILRDPQIIETLSADRSSRLPGMHDAMLETLTIKAAKIVCVIEKYLKAGSGEVVLADLKKLRDQRLAHHQTDVEPEGKISGAAIEAFYMDMAKVIETLLSLVEATAYDTQDTAEVHRHHARFFWASVCGERTEGHPNYRKPEPPQAGPSEPPEWFKEVFNTTSS